MIERRCPHTTRASIDKYLSMEETAAILAKLKPAFIHHPDCKRLLYAEIVVELGGDPTKTYLTCHGCALPTLQLPYVRIAYAFHPHRDTVVFGSHVPDKLVAAHFWTHFGNCLAFHTNYFDEAVKNNSLIYNYYEWNAHSRV